MNTDSKTDKKGRKMKQKRIILDLSEDGMKKVDDLKQKLGLKTRPEVARYALGLTGTVQGYIDDGYTLQFSKGGEAIKVILITSN